jgi:hypothetical protein
VPTIGALLGHAGSVVTSGYIHKVDAALIAAANRIADAIDGMMSGELGTTNVIPLQSRASAN